jgi:hypothetical protein
VLAFANMVHLFADEFSGLRGGSFALAFVFRWRAPVSFFSGIRISLAIEVFKSQQLPNLVLHNGFDELAPVRRSSRQRLGKMRGLLCRDLGRHRGFVGIDNRFDNDRPGRLQGAIQNLTAFAWIVDGKTGPAASARKIGKVDGREIAFVLGIPKEHHLFPADLAERIVFHDDDLDGQLISDGGDEFRHQHAESAVAHKADAEAIRIRELRSDGVGKSASHGGEISGHRMHLAALRGNVARPPGGDGPESQLTMASAGKRLPSSAASRCGFIGFAVTAAC